MLPSSSPDSVEDARLVPREQGTGDQRLHIGAGTDTIQLLHTHNKPQTQELTVRSPSKWRPLEEKRGGVELDETRFTWKRQSKKHI